MTKRKNTSRCEVCTGKNNEPRKRPYGTTGTNPYCDSCDCGSTYKISKSSHRNNVKKEIDKMLEEIRPWTIKLTKSKDE